MSMLCIVLAAMAGMALLGSMTSMAQADDGREAKRIKPFAGNPRYWQYHGRPVMLLGGSMKDNLFQIPDLKEHLDLLHSVGGNYIRNTMSDRPAAGYEKKAFKRLDDGRYDLNQWNEEYWQKFEDMLKLTAERDIIVQIEVWDRFDHSRENWESDPFNPANNINYTHEQSGLEAKYPQHPGANKQPFFYTVPELSDNKVVLPYQQRFVDKMLSYSLQYDHVLYCMDNETSGSPKWGAYWAAYVRGKAKDAGIGVEMTEMWDAWNVRDKSHLATFDNPQLYGFVDLAQNSHATGQANWDGAQHVRQYLARRPRPMNSTKIYGAETSPWLNRGISETHAVQTFWRNIIGGFASSRFHRPPAGIGLSETTQTQIRSARLLLAELDMLRCISDSRHTLLRDRAENSAYLTRIDGEQYAIYFTDGGSVGLDLGEAKGTFRGKWLEVDASRWADEGFEVEGGEVAKLQAPGKGQWVALLKSPDARMEVALSGPQATAANKGKWQPKGVFLTPERVAELRKLVEAKSEPTFTAWQALQKKAEAALEAEPHAPESWYVPGYYRDAEGHRSAKNGLQDDANNSYTLALAWRMTDDERYAKAAIRLIDAWPQTVREMSRKDDSTLSFSYHFPSMIFAADLIRGYEGWPAERQQAFADFVRHKALPMNTMTARNNWGNWGLVLASACASYLGDKDLFDSCVTRWKELLATQVAEDGHLPHEVTRSNGRHGIWYSHFCLMPQVLAAEILRVGGGEDLLDYRTPETGRSVRLAFEKLTPWVRNPETFHYWKGEPKDLVAVGYFSYFELLNPRWPNDDATFLLQRARPMTAQHSAPHLTFTHGQPLPELAEQQTGDDK